MEEPPPIPAPAQKQAMPPSTSLAARLLNVFAIPGAVFDEVKASKFKAANWVVPMMVSAIVAVLWVWTMFSQPAFQQKLRERQEKVFARQVQAGNVSQADVDRTLNLLSNPLILKALAGVGAVVASALRLFWWGLVLWLLGRWFLKARFDLLKGLEVSGLAGMISVLGMIVCLLLVVNLGPLFASPNLALVATDFESTRRAQLLAGAFDVFSFWQLAVSALGLAKLARVPFLRSVLVVFPFWCIQEALFAGVGMGGLAL